MAGLINIDLGKALDSVSGVLKQVLPDPNKRAELESQINQLAITAQTEVDKAQVQLDSLDANSNSFFRWGWRPACGWLCVFGLLWSTVIKTGIEWVSVISKHPVTLPNVETGILVTLLIGMLGLGTQRTIEKIQGK